MNKIEQTSYIIGYRQAQPERLEALKFVLGLLRSFFPDLEIMLVEQDSEVRLQLDERLNVRQVFLKNSGLYNRSRGYNFGASQTGKEVLVFADSDVFLTKAGFEELFEAGACFEAATPSKTELLNVAITDVEQQQFEVLNTRQLYTFAGGMMLITRAGFEKIGGWDERFEGWGGEDEAMSHVVFGKLTSKTFRLPFYHIDHPRSENDGKLQSKYQFNRQLVEEILTMNGAALERYVGFLRKQNEAKKEFRPKFVLVITTYNRPEYLKALMESFFTTRNNDFEWKIILADDGSEGETMEFLEKMEKEHGAIIIRNNQVDVHRQVNTILKQLGGMDFDLCFRCDDDVLFLKKGWDDLYWQCVQRTGYGHLVFYDTRWNPSKNLDRPIQCGGLVAHCEAGDVQGGFYTLTPEVLRAVGFFDEQRFGRRALGHIDFTFRCCRAGFNVLAHPFDVVGSNAFLKLQSTEYRPSISRKYKASENPREVLDFKRKLLSDNRIFIPYNENFYASKTEKTAQITKRRANSSNNKVYRRADATFYPERGIGGFVGMLLKRLYNLGLDLRLYFIPKAIKSLGRVLSKIGLDLMNIEQ